MPSDKAPSRTYTTTLIAGFGDVAMSAVDVPFNPKEVFGKVRAPVAVTLNGYTYRSTICAMGKKPDGSTAYLVPLRASHRTAAGVKGGQTLRVTLALDRAPRAVTAPKDLAAALRKAGLLEAFKAMSYTHQREHVEAVEEAKKPETRARRIGKCVEMVGEWAGKKEKAGKRVVVKQAAVKTGLKKSESRAAT